MTNLLGPLTLMSEKFALKSGPRSITMRSINNGSNLGTLKSSPKSPDAKFGRIFSTDCSTHWAGFGELRGHRSMIGAGG